MRAASSDIQSVGALHKIGIVSDIHYAGAAEQARGEGYNYAGIDRPLMRALVRSYRHHLWLRNPLAQNHLLDAFLERVPPLDYVIANGDYTCDSAFVGVSDDAAHESVSECLGKLRGRFGDSFQANFGDHELGKKSLLAGLGGMRLTSWHRAQNELHLHSLWRVELGRYVLIGVTSSLLALPVYEADVLADERAEWEKLREQHLEEIRITFDSLPSTCRVLLFCHDPSALPFLWREAAVRNKLPQVEQTIIGHLHSNLVFWKSRMLAGMPAIPFLGHTTRRLSAALNEARCWKPFRVRLCPALAGIELLKDGGFYTVELNGNADSPAKFEFHRIER